MDRGHPYPGVACGTADCLTAVPQSERRIRGAIRSAMKNQTNAGPEIPHGWSTSKSPLPDLCPDHRNGQNFLRGLQSVIKGPFMTLQIPPPPPQPPPPAPHELPHPPHEEKKLDLA